MARVAKALTCLAVLLAPGSATRLLEEDVDDVDIRDEQRLAEKAEQAGGEDAEPKKDEKKEKKKKDDPKKKEKKKKKGEKKESKTFREEVDIITDGKDPGIKKAPGKGKDGKGNGAGKEPGVIKPEDPSGTGLPDKPLDLESVSVESLDGEPAQRSTMAEPLDGDSNPGAGKPNQAGGMPGHEPREQEKRWFEEPSTDAEGKMAPNVKKGKKGKDAGKGKDILDDSPKYRETKFGTGMVIIDGKGPGKGKTIEGKEEEKEGPGENDEKRDPLGEKKEAKKKKDDDDDADED